MTPNADKLVPPQLWASKALLEAPSVLLRHISGDRIALAMGVREITHGRGGVMLHVADGTRFRSARAPDGSKQRSLSEWVLADVTWVDGEALHVVRFGDWFSVICMWRQRSFAGWHVNFQRPLKRSALGWDTEDLVLDIEVAPDRSWSVEDLAELEDAADEGHVDAKTRGAVLVAVDEALVRLDRGDAPFSDDWTVPPQVVPGPVPLPQDWESLRA